MRQHVTRRGILYLIGAIASLAILAAVALPLLLLGNGASAASFLVPFAASASPRPSGAPSLHEQTPTSAPVAPTASATHSPTANSPTPNTSSGTSSATTGATPNGCAIASADLSGEQHLLSLLNAHRAAVGAAALRLDATLSGEARAHSCDMYQHATLSHTGSDGSTPFQRIQAAGVTYREAGENIGDASGYTLTAGLELDDRDMMAEPLMQGNHHWNIVNAGYSRVGLGVIYQSGKLYFTEDFVG